MACGQQVLHASCCLTHCSAPGRLQSGAFPILKVRQAHSLIHSTRKKAFRPNFFGRFTAACVARGGGREPDKGGLCGLQTGAPLFCVDLFENVNLHADRFGG